MMQNSTVTTDRSSTLAGMALSLTMSVIDGDDMVG
ncbi:Os08g0310001 [Oryza sativa Japonica Group]|uniref:Os08g0310001 protein n=1 Tax=Oryza sativa subsp. japonica TaxID=39947 RepID=C7J606_ORYSJ|nr:Os08g0310001 [Oryza sativa Japonica Group]|eukprot:NP_001175513.1 Os08g0310001 [Oryza sativa Japonica Group]